MDSLDIIRGFLTNLGIHSQLGWDGKLRILDAEGGDMLKIIRKCNSLGDVRFVCERRATDRPFSYISYYFIEKVI